MVRLIFVAALIAVSTSNSLAQTRQFPYDARVVVDEAYVRSGGGEQFYPTQVLPRDAVVRVRRHDPGGWFMIEPPKGSFSWIPEKFVRQVSRNSAEIIESNVVVFVGSAFGDETHVWQRKMMSGETVEVIGRRDVDTLTGPKPMLKIKPPAREYRWVPGSALVPVNENQRMAQDNDPYAVPTEIVERTSAAPAAESMNEQKAGFAPSDRLQRLKRIREEQRQLYEIDQKFRFMVLSDPAQWDLQEIEQQYLQLQEAVTHKPIAGQIDLRYPAINRYRVRKAEIDELKQLTSATERRDAQLMASQYGVSQAAGDGFEFGQSSDLAGVSMIPPLSTNVLPGLQSEFGVASNDEIGVNAGTPGSSIANIPIDSKYIGAGFLQRSVGDSKTAYLLTSPSGRVLAHLKADESVDLESYVGRSVGLKGSRWFDDQIKSDYIEVSELEEVRIRQ